jgi:hypothetical protein
MDNPETLATLGKQENGTQTKTHTQHQENRPVANHCRLQLKGPFVLNKESFLQNKDYLSVSSVFFSARGLWNRQ